MKKKILLIIGIILVVIIGLFGYLVVEDFKQEDILKQEIVNLTNKDLSKDDYTIEVKTKGDYAYIEEAIKKFYKELSDNVKALNYYFSDEELTNILSVDSLEKGRPNFQSSYQLLEKTRKNSLAAIQRIAELCEEEAIKNLIDKEKVDDYSYELYLDLMYTKEDLKEFRETKEGMQELATNLEQFLNKVEEILDFLKANNDSWFVQSGQLYFETHELVDQYNKLYQDLQKLAESFSTSSNWQDQHQSRGDSAGSQV